MGSISDFLSRTTPNLESDAFRVEGITRRMAERRAISCQNRKTGVTTTPVFLCSITGEVSSWGDFEIE